ncbi:MAG: RluA family pseudouridine synthase [Ilumatobacteraceae bacterium]
MIEEEVPAALDGERLDRVVALVAECSRSAAAAMLAAGGVSVDGAAAEVGKVRLRVGQVVRVDPEVLPAEEGPSAEAGVEFAVVHVDDDIVVVDKPAGLVVHPGSGHASGTLVNGLLSRFPDLVGVGERHRPGIVHRLDVGTSGLLVVARTELAYRRLSTALAERTVGRRYTALVWGTPENPQGVVDAPIGRDVRDPTRMAVVVGGRPSRTRYVVLKTYSHPAVAALLECALETGRTHQIRVHLAAIGHPVVGDATYGGVRTAVVCPRPFLHAASLTLDHPRTGTSMTFTSPLPADLVAVEGRFSD